MPKFFGYVNEVYSHNKPRRSGLVLEKLWVTQCGWLRLCMEVDMGITITNFWKLFSYGVKRNHYEKLIGIREFLERISLDWLNNPFTTETGTLSKITPLLDKINDREKFLTHREIIFSSSVSCSMQVSTISYFTTNSDSPSESTLAESTIGLQNTSGKEVAK